MPKITLPSLPVSGLFAVAKPSGPPSMTVVNDMKQLINKSPLFVEASKLSAKEKGRGKKARRFKDNVKTGQGGTLDPLADGVLVIGVGKGTKKLQEFLDCVKEYQTTCLLGCETDSYDSHGSQVRTAPWKHVTREKVEGMLDRFRGEIEQTPPIFSALKMDGIPLYEYARKGIPLPRPIEKRKVTVHALELTNWRGSDHDFHYPEKKFTEEERQALAKSLQTVEEHPEVQNEPEPEPDSEDMPPAPFAFDLTMRVSGGTYVRSIVHDLAHALGSAGHVVTLQRSRQGRFALEPTQEKGEFGCVPWEIFKKAVKDEGEADEDGWHEWEREVMTRLDVVQ